jgi:hypothetical protein
MPPGSPLTFCKNFLISSLEDKVDSKWGGHVRDLTYLTPQVGIIIYFHVIKFNINKAWQ